MGFSAVFCFSFWGGGVKLSNPSKAPFMAFGPKRRQAAAEANCFPPMNPTKDVSSRFFGQALHVRLRQIQLPHGS